MRKITVQSCSAKLPSSANLGHLLTDKQLGGLMTKQLGAGN